jgi:hypothetical protein
MAQEMSFADERANLRRTFIRVYRAGRGSAGLRPREQATHLRRTIQTAMNDLEHFTMQHVDD